MTIAIWCILIAQILPYVAFSFVKGIDPEQPRFQVGGLIGQSVRAYGAHLNGLETFPWFAAAVIVAHMVGGPSRIVDILAVIYILAVRIGHLAAYSRRSAASSRTAASLSASSSRWRSSFRRCSARLGGHFTSRR